MLLWLVFFFFFLNKKLCPGGVFDVLLSFCHYNGMLMLITISSNEYYYIVKKTHPPLGGHSRSECLFSIQLEGFFNNSTMRKALMKRC